MITRKKGRCVERQLNFTLINEHLQRTTALIYRTASFLSALLSVERNEQSTKAREEDVMIKVFVQADEEKSLSQITRAV